MAERIETASLAERGVVDQVAVCYLRAVKALLRTARRTETDADRRLTAALDELFAPADSRGST